PALREQVIAAQRERLAPLSQEAVAEQVRECFQGLLSGHASPSPAPLQEASVELVCPGFTVRPEAPESRLARELAKRIPGARILALRPRGEGPSLTLGAVDVDGVPVWHFTPDQPPGRAPAPLPGAS